MVIWPPPRKVTLFLWSPPLRLMKIITVIELPIKGPRALPRCILQLEVRRNYAIWGWVIVLTVDTSAYMCPSGSCFTAWKPLYKFWWWWSSTRECVGIVRVETSKILCCQRYIMMPFCISFLISVSRLFFSLYGVLLIKASSNLNLIHHPLFCSPRSIKSSIVNVSVQFPISRMDSEISCPALARWCLVFSPAGWYWNFVNTGTVTYSTKISPLLIQQWRYPLCVLQPVEQVENYHQHFMTTRSISTQKIKRLELSCIHCNILKSICSIFVPLSFQSSIISLLHLPNVIIFPLVRMVWST